MFWFLAFFNYYFLPETAADDHHMLSSTPLFMTEVSAPYAALHLPLLTPNLNSKHHYFVPGCTRKVGDDSQYNWITSWLSDPELGLSLGVFLLFPQSFSVKRSKRCEDAWRCQSNVMTNLNAVEKELHGTEEKKLFWELSQRCEPQEHLLRYIFFSFVQLTCKRGVHSLWGTTNLSWFLRQRNLVL